MIAPRNGHRLPARAALALLLHASVSAGADDALLVEVTGEVGIDFVHEDGALGRLLLPEIMGPGVALFDYDRDGDLDLYLVQSGALLASAEATRQLDDEDRIERDRLYRNDLSVAEDGSRRLRFTDVTEEVGIDARGYGQGVAIGDVDGDGWQDVYLTNLGPNQLWRNREGRFTLAQSGAEDPRWSTSATFLDADGDGDLDLFVANYAVWSVDSTVTCFASSSRRDYCGPQSYPAQADGFFRNRGDGTFEETHRSPLAAAPGSGLGVVGLDVDDDGTMEIFVANDGMENRLWFRDGDTLRDEGLLGGVAVNREGRPEASMGVAVGDVDGDGDADLFLTHLDGETNTLLVNEGGGLFSDRTIATGLAADGIAETSFGTALADLDLDGRLDLVIVSGAVRLASSSGAAGGGLAQPNRLLRNTGPGRGGLPVFEPWPPQAAPAMAEPRVSRGLAVGDLDNDGDLDLVVTNTDGPAQVLSNRTDPEGWLGLELVRAPDHGPPLLGWRAAVVQGDRILQVREVRVDGSYLSSNDPRLLLPWPPTGATLHIVPPGSPLADAAGSQDTREVPLEAAMRSRYTSWSPNAGGEP